MAYSKPMSILAETAPLLALQVAPEDDVAVALHPLEAGQTVRVGMVDVQLRDPVPAGHKFALHEIPAGAPVRRYRAPIGLAPRAILAGEHVHSHNLHTALSGELAYRFPGAQPREGWDAGGGPCPVESERGAG